MPSSAGTTQGSFESEAGLRDVLGTFTLSLPFDLADCQLLGPQHTVNLGDRKIIANGTVGNPDEQPSGADFSCQ